MPNNKKIARKATEIEFWLIDKISRCSKGLPTTLDPKSSFSECGLDSVQTVSLMGDMEVWLGTKLSPTLPWDYPTIKELAEHLASGDHRKG
ncbi:MAG: acyl carrier protein [Elusimicrobia bacterium]|nr:acyl carrier protein [Elusimicrobiota bacterium]